MSKLIVYYKEKLVEYLMNDWEIGGTQNPWVCPSDRHLQLRAQLKSGWSVRTATARSPTTTKQQQTGAISDAEQEQIRKVLARAEAGRQHEEERIGKMVDRLEKMRTRATGNGVTQCLLCQTEFGLLAAKSYAAMCLDCRKYVCQKNCGVETFDQKRGEPIFLCKICSEYREVIKPTPFKMWKKSGAWFYKEMPTFKKPAESPVCNNNVSSGYLTSPGIPSSSHAIPSSNSAWLPSSVNSSGYRAGSISTTGTSPMATVIHGVNADNSSNPMSPNYNSRQRQLPIPPDQQQRFIAFKTTPRPRITPSWVHEKVQSSMSIGSEDEESSSSSSIDAAEFKPNTNATTTNTTAPIPSSRHHHYNRPRELKHGNGGPTSSTNSNSASASHLRSNMQRFTLSNRSRITDTDESENDESRRTTPSTSPRHSLATPSSYGGDDLSQNHTTLATNEASDSKSIDSGVVQSDHSMQQLRQQSAFTTGAATAVSPPPNLTTVQIAQNLRNMGNVAATQWNAAFGPTTMHQAPPRPSTDVGSGLANSETNQTSSTVPPIPPRSTVLVSSVLPSTSNVTTNRRSSNASTSTNNSQPRASNPTSSRESLSAVQPIQSARSRPISTDRNTTPSLQMGSRESLSIAPIENELPVESPTFMSSPEEDTKVIKSLEKRRWSPASRLTAAIGSLHSRSNRSPCVKSISLQYSMDSAKSPPPAVIPMTRKSRAHKFRLLSSRLSATVDEHMGGNDVGKEETMPSRTPSPRRPTSASSMLATINETSNNAAQARNPEMDLPRRPSSAIVLSNASRRSGSKSSSPHLRCFCFPHRSFRGGTLGAIQFNLTYLAEDKQLVIHLIRAKNLKAMDKNGFSDPYVKFHLIPGNAKATKLTSKTIEKTLNPEWNEEMIYYGITEEERLKKTLRVTVLDRDRIGSDFLGETRVALKKLPLGQTKKFNLYLEHAMPAPVCCLQPEIVIRVQLEKAEEVERGKILLSICYNIQQGSLFVNIKRCAELLGMDSSGFSDPYCKVYVTSKMKTTRIFRSLTPLTSKAHRQRTAIKKRTLNPEFNEILKFIVPFKDLPKKTLEIGVYDHDVARHDDYIGGIVLSTAAKGDRGVQWTQCIENPGKTFEYWHRLETD
ncbi:Rabphilin-1 [Aphelenchoides besseyi]|nr:Rabphilin-1 [Aphelenchoides besseyi]